MGVQFTIIFMVDFLKLIVILKLIFGFEFRCGIRTFLLEIGVMICTVAIIFLMKDPSNRIFLNLGSQILMMMILFVGKRNVIGKITVLTHFGISILDSLCMGWLLLFFEGYNLTFENKIFFNLICTFIGMLLILFLTVLFYPKRKTIKKYFDHFRLKKFFYYFFYILISGIVLGYAEIMVIDAEIVYRMRAVVEISASIFGILIIASGIMIDVLTIQKYRLDGLVKENSNCIKEQIKQYIILEKKETELRRFHHDYNAHMQALHSLSENKQILELHQYIESLETIQKSLKHLSTNNIIGDAIINGYYEKGIAVGVDVEVIGKFPDSIELSLTDLCIILSNTLSNAYEAALVCSDNRKIMVTIGTYRQKVFITIKNPTIKEPAIIDGIIHTTKADKENHGIGIGNVLDVVERNNGYYHMGYNDGYLIVEIQV